MLGVETGRANQICKIVIKSILKTLYFFFEYIYNKKLWQSY